jgi:hypothetical protein
MPKCKDCNCELDLIDRNELYNQIILHLNRHSLGETTPWTTLTVGEIASIIANRPLVEAEPIRHGKWINEPPYTADEKYLKGQECSICHSYFVSDGNKPYSNHPYCPQCGARMEGE